MTAEEAYITAVKPPDSTDRLDGGGLVRRPCFFTFFDAKMISDFLYLRFPFMFFPDGFFTAVSLILPFSGLRLC